MKLRYTFLSILASITLLSCNDRELFISQNENDTNIKFEQNILYPTDDGSIELSGTNCERIVTLLNKFDSSIENKLAGDTWSLPNAAQLQEIKTFTDELVKGLTTETEKYDKIFEWVTTNIKYWNGSQDNPEGAGEYYYPSNFAYSTFIDRVAVCQGYAALLQAMCYTQQIQCLIANGYMIVNNQNLGHAWNYLKADGKWLVSDPTNGGKYNASDIASYSHLDAMMLSSNLYEDANFAYNYNNGYLNIVKIKSLESTVVIPYSVNGVKVTMLSTKTEMDPNTYMDITNANVTELYIGKNITSLGDYPDEIARYCPNIKDIHVDPENAIFESQTGVIYSKNNDKYKIEFIAPKVTRIELKALDTIDKECKLEYLSELEVIVFDASAEYIYPWAIGNCPKLNEVHAPTDCEFDELSIYRNGDESNKYESIDLIQTGDVRIVYFEPTGIPQIKI